MVENLSKSGQILPNELPNLKNQALGLFVGPDTSPIHMNGCI